MYYLGEEVYIIEKMRSLLQIIMGSMLLSIIHASIPNHWMPLVLIGKTEKWNDTETLSITFIVSSLHVLSTVIVGILIGFIGYRLSSTYEFITSIGAPLILIGLGFFYFLMDLKMNHHHVDTQLIISDKSKITVILSLGTAMFFSPCIEIEAYYFTASKLGWSGIIAVSLIYFFVTVIGMLLFVYLCLKGFKKVRWQFIEKHEKRVTGVVLIVLGVFVLLTEM